MKIVFLSICLIFTLNASEYYAKIKAVNSYKVKASVSGKVIYVNESIKANYAENSTIVKLDDKLDKIELKASKKKLQLLNESIEIEDKNLQRYKKVSSKPQYERDNQKLKIINLLSSKADLENKIEVLKDNIKNKTLAVKSNYIFDISVKEGDYVNPGTLLYESKDLSKGKLEFYVPIEKIEEIKTKNIYLDGKKTDIKINKIYKVADESHLSSYKIELILPKVDKFSRLVKIEFK